ncbi:MAG: hypothetical protein ACYDCQ_14795 [Dehalococcoidia bacterium]
MYVKELVAWAREYEDADDASPAEAMLSVLIELYTCDVLDDDDAIDADVFHRAWVRLTRDLEVPDWLDQAQTLAEGVDVLAANLVESGRPELAAELREISTPRFDGAAASAELDVHLLRRQRAADAALDVAELERPWTPRPSGGLKMQGV